MPTVTTLEAKSSLSRLVEAVESGKESEYIITRNGKPAARLVPLESARTGPRIGIARGLFVAHQDINDGDDVIEAMFHATDA
jgi:prevent-host-death family protein